MAPSQKGKEVRGRQEEKNKTWRVMLPEGGNLAKCALVCGFHDSDGCFSVFKKIISNHYPNFYFDTPPSLIKVLEQMPFMRRVECVWNVCVECGIPLSLGWLFIHQSEFRDSLCFQTFCLTPLSSLKSTLVDILTPLGKCLHKV